MAQKNDDIAFSNHSEISVKGIQGIEAIAAGSGAVQGRAQLATNDARFAHAADNDGTATVTHLFTGLLEKRWNVVCEPRKGFRFFAENIASKLMGGGHGGGAAKPQFAESRLWFRGQSSAPAGGREGWGAAKVPNNL